jgi:hypothetical protein
VGDYALNLARALAAGFHIQTVFAVPQSDSEMVAGFSIRSFEQSSVAAAPLAQHTDYALLHYVNYGYHPRGIPMWLPLFLKELCRNVAVSTIFHELYASSSPWHSAFWLRPWQKRIAREVAQASRQCVVSNSVIEGQLRHLEPAASISIQPVASNLGEPALSPGHFTDGNPHRWVICGGSALLRRSIDSFARIISSLPQSFKPDQLFVLGGKESTDVRSALSSLQDMEIIYRPELSAEEASGLLSQCTFGWIDYLDRQKVPLGLILKSSSFAACAAHGIIPVFPWNGEQICVNAHCLPGPFFVTPSQQRLPSENEWPQIRFQFYDWYHRQAAVPRLAEKVARFLDEDERSVTSRD